MNRSIWRKKAINNRVTAMVLAEEYGGEVKTYLLKSNKVLRQKINTVNLIEKEIHQHGIPERLETVVSVPDRNNHRRTPNCIVPDFAFA